jgi:general L-amino acid transport system permease protein
MSDVLRAFPPGAHPDFPPPHARDNVWTRIRRRLFAGPSQAGLTLVAVAALAWALPPLIEWAFVKAVWSGAGPTACPPAATGACWIIVGAWLKALLAGFYPATELWRPILALALLPFAAAPLFVSRLPVRRAWFALTALYPILVYALTFGIGGLTRVPTENWGGLLLTLIVGLTGIGASLPIGIALALGRRSDLPVMRLLATLAIELPRGVPLITLLFMASVMLPLFLPAGLELDKLMRALVVVALFASAYMAEVVRGGLQAVPKGQVEAAEALGLRYWQVMGRIVLPQALTHVIPGIVNTFIGLFKDTTLVAIIGLFDLLGIANAALQDPQWLGRPGGFFLEIYAFAAVIYFAFCFAMSRLSAWLEGRLAHTDQRSAT